jgi:hypothetical protein
MKQGSYAAAFAKKCHAQNGSLRHRMFINAQGIERSLHA